MPSSPKVKSTAGGAAAGAGNGGGSSGGGGPSTGLIILLVLTAATLIAVVYLLFWAMPALTATVNSSHAAQADLVGMVTSVSDSIAVPAPPPPLSGAPLYMIKITYHRSGPNGNAFGVVGGYDLYTIDYHNTPFSSVAWGQYRDIALWQAQHVALTDGNAVDTIWDGGNSNLNTGIFAGFYQNTITLTDAGASTGITAGNVAAGGRTMTGLGAPSNPMIWLNRLYDLGDAGRTNISGGSAATALPATAIHGFALSSSLHLLDVIVQPLRTTTNSNGTAGGFAANWGAGTGVGFANVTTPDPLLLYDYTGLTIQNSSTVLGGTSAVGVTNSAPPFGMVDKRTGVTSLLTVANSAVATFVSGNNAATSIIDQLGSYALGFYDGVIWAPNRDAFSLTIMCTDAQ